MDERRMHAYLCSLEPEAEPLLTALRAQAEEDGVPILRVETEAFLRTLVAAKQPERILEIGTAIGYSALCMARACAAQITTIESYEKRIPLAQETFQKGGITNRVKLIHGDAGVVLRELSGSFDFVFLDAAKGQYLRWLPDILRLMAPGALLVSDNVLQEGTVLESRFTVERRERTTHSRMREFLYEIKHHPLLESAVLPLGDGVSLSVKRDGAADKEMAKTKAKAEGAAADSATIEAEKTAANRVIVRAEEKAGEANA